MPLYLPKVPPFLPFHAVSVRRMRWRNLAASDRRRYMLLWNRARRSELRAFAVAERMGLWLQSRMAGMRTTPTSEQ